MSNRNPFDYRHDHPVYEWQIKQQEKQNEIDELLEELRLLGRRDADDVANRLELIRIKPYGWQQKKWVKARLETMGKGYLIIGRVARKAKKTEEVSEDE